MYEPDGKYTPAILPEVAAICSSLEDDILQVDAVFNHTRTIRQRVIERIETAVMMMEIDPDRDDAETFSSKMRAVEALSGLLNDQEKNVINRANIKLKKKDSDQAHALGINVVELINQVHNMPNSENFGNRFKISEQERDQLIDRAFDAGGTVIIEEELVESNDVSELSDVLAVEMSTAVSRDQEL